MLTFGVANAQEQKNSNTLVFPISELGNCVSASDCKTYCDKLENAEACTKYGEEHGLVSSSDAANGLKLKNVKTGPGGCTTKEACKIYCSDATHAEECAQFAEKFKLLDPNQLAKFRKFYAGIADNKKPIDCHDQHTCETFCAMRSNNEKCLKFAKDNNLVDEEHAMEISKFQQAINNGETPGACESKEACKTFCSDENNKAECLAFAATMGWIKFSDLERLRTERFHGPGDCDSKDACEAFCNKTENQEACLEFARKMKLLNSDQVEKIKDATNAVKEIQSRMPEGLENCLKMALGDELFAKMRTGQFSPDDKTAANIRACLVKFAEIRKVNSENSEESTTPPPTNCITNIEGVVVNRCRSTEGSVTPPVVPTQCIVKIEGVLVNRCQKESTPPKPESTNLDR